MIVDNLLGRQLTADENQAIHDFSANLEEIIRVPVYSVRIRPQTQDELAIFGLSFVMDLRKKQ